MNRERPPDGKAHYDLFDNLDSMVDLTDSSIGSKDNSDDDDPSGQIKAQQEGEANSWKFAAGSLDSSTGLYKFGERYYDPNLGRWTQLDSAGTGYVYANDNPVNEVDPSGRISSTCGESWVIPNPPSFSLGAGLGFVNIDYGFIADPILGEVLSFAGIITVDYSQIYYVASGVNSESYSNTLQNVYFGFGEHTLTFFGEAVLALGDEEGAVCWIWDKITIDWMG